MVMVMVWRADLKFENGFSIKVEASVAFWGL